MSSTTDEQKRRVSKIWGLWGGMRRQGLVTDGTMGELFAICKRVTGVERPEDMTSEQIALTVAALKKWRARHGAPTAASNRRAR